VPENNLPVQVLLTGFVGAQSVFAESVTQDARAILAKIGREAGVRSLEIRLKSGVHGKGMLYEIKAAARLDRGTLYAGATARELHLALHRTFHELMEQAAKLSSFKSGIHAKEPMAV
jgi:hypothetical protein